LVMLGFVQEVKSPAPHFAPVLFLKVTEDGTVLPIANGSVLSRLEAVELISELQGFVDSDISVAAPVAPKSAASDWGLTAQEWTIESAWWRDGDEYRESFRQAVLECYPHPMGEAFRLPNGDRNDVTIDIHLSKLESQSRWHFGDRTEMCRRTLLGYQTRARRLEALADRLNQERVQPLPLQAIEAQETEIEVLPSGDLEPPPGGKKKRNKKASNPYSQAFTTWWDGYYGSCLLVGAKAGNKSDAWVQWQVRYPADRVDPDFLEGDRYYQEAIKLEFAQKGQAIAVAHGCRYIRDERWREELDRHHLQSRIEPQSRGAQKFDAGVQAILAAIGGAA
jgi:hypothetical protein